MKEISTNNEESLFNQISYISTEEEGWKII